MARLALSCRTARGSARRRGVCDSPRRCLSSLLSLWLVASACGSQEAQGPTHAARDSAGVRIIETGGQSGTQLVAPVHVVDLVPPDEVLNATPWGVAAGVTTGRIYVADRLSRRVLMFDALGGFIGSLGRLGGGPGEFRNPSAIYLGTDDVLRVWDTGRGVISRWSSQGEHLGEDRPDLPYWGPGFAIDGKRLITVTNHQSEAGLGMIQRLEVLQDGRPHVLHRLQLPMQVMELPCMTGPGPTVLAPTLTWTSRGDTTFVHRYPDYRVDVFEDTTLVSSIRRAVPPISVTEEMASEAVEFGPTPYRALLRTCNVTPNQVVHAVGYEEQASPIMALAVHPDGGLWITRTEDGISPSSVDVFEPDGTYRFELNVTGAVVGFPSRSAFLTLRLDRATGEPRLSLYSLDPAAASRNQETPAPDEGRLVTETGSSRTEEDRSPPPQDENLELGDEFRDCPGCPLMVVIPPGRFVMGSPEGEAIEELAERWHHLFLDERPQVGVEIDYSLAFGKYEVTFAEWDQCREAGGCASDPDDEGFGRESRPVLNVGPLQAQEYVTWLSKKTGRVYRLPSEAEWEYAARAGSSSARYWGQEIGEGRAACDGCGGRWNGQSTAPIGSFEPNDFGLHDMLGNASEWVSDCYFRGNDAGPGDGQPVRGASPYWEDGSCTVFVFRGGAWRDQTWVVRAAGRTPFNTSGPWGFSGGPTMGLRVVRELNPRGPGGQAPASS